MKALNWAPTLRIGNDRRVIVIGRFTGSPDKKRNRQVVNHVRRGVDPVRQGRRNENAYDRLSSARITLAASARVMARPLSFERSS